MSDRHSRRRFLKCGVVASTALLAGCTGGNNTGGGGADGNNTGGGGTGGNNTGGGGTGGNNTGGGGTDGGSSPNLALSVPTLEFTFYARMQNGFQSVKKSGRISSNSKFYNAQGDQSTQISNVETAISNNPDVLLISPVTADGILPALKKADEAGIPVIASDRDFSDQGYRRTFVGSDNTALARRSSKLLLQFVNGESNKDRYNLIQIKGNPGDPNARLRADGFQSVVKGNDSLNLLDSQTGKYTTQDALNAMTDLITRHGEEIDGVFCHNDLMAIGVHQAFSDNNMSRPITGVDGSESWVKLFEDNNTYGTLAQLPEEMVDKEVKLSKRILSDKNVKNRYVVSGRKVTSKNASDYLNEYFQ